MHRKSFLTASLSILAAAVSHAAFIPVNLSGTTQYDGWYSMTRAAYPAYATNLGGVGTLPTYASDWPAAFGSNTVDSGDALFNKTAGSSSGFATTGSYQSFGAASFLVYDTTVVSNLQTIVFQIEANYDAAGGFASGVVPALFINGEVTGLAADYTKYIANSGVYNPTYATYSYQWDLSDIATPITSFSINWNGPASNGQITAMQLNQGSEFTQVVPEPSTWALISIAAIGALFMARRRLA